MAVSRFFSFPRRGATTEIHGGSKTAPHVFKRRAATRIFDNDHGYHHAVASATKIYESYLWIWLSRDGMFLRLREHSSKWPNPNSLT